MNVETHLKQHSKQIPNDLKLKLQQLVTNINNQHYARWTNKTTLIILDNPEVVTKITQLFDMSLKTFIKFIQMIGINVQKINGDMNEQNVQYKIEIVQSNQANNQQKYQNNILKQLMQNMTIKQENNPNYQQLSIQVNLRRPQNQLMNVEQQIQYKDAFLNKFKNHTDSINDFIYQAIYQIFTSRQSNRYSPCQIVQLLTQLRDRISENQKQLEDCIQQFKSKINTLNQQSNQNEYQKSKIILEKQEEGNMSEEPSINAKIK